MLLVLSQIVAAALVSMMLSASGCVMASDQIQGSGVAKTETRDVPAFTRIETTGSADVIVTIGDKQSMTVEADDNILPLLTTEVKGDKLVIGSRDSYSPRTNIKITITVPSLDGASVSGSGQINVTGVNGKKFDAQITGSGQVNLVGQADSLNATIAGSGNLEATKFTVSDATVRVTGSGDAKVNATKSLNATVTGSGDVRYTGRPSSVQEQVHGSGSVKKM